MRVRFAQAVSCFRKGWQAGKTATNEKGQTMAIKAIKIRVVEKSSGNSFVESRGSLKAAREYCAFVNQPRGNGLTLRATIIKK